LLLSAPAFGQSTAASLGGTVMDASQAVLPGAAVTAINTATGVETKTTTNNSGVYNFPSLQPGVYNVVAVISGFQTATKTDVRLGMGSQTRLNFDLVVAGTTTEVEVTTSVENVILDAGSSTGTVLQENAVIELPLVANDAMELINVMGGVVKSESPTFYGDQQTFAGVSGNNINISRDGISVNEIRYNSGITSPARLNPELVGEFKMVLSPVDAEMGRGAGQVQMTTKSGTNAFHGSGVWNIQNSALDAYDYSDKDQAVVNPRAWRNLHNYTLSVSGPIIKNKTFFFASWDQAIARGRTSLSTRVLTNCARKGIYRYLTGVRNTNALADPAVISGTTPQRPTVDFAGNPLLNYTFPDNPMYGAFSGQQNNATLMYQSVLGELDSTALAQIAAEPVNCSQYLPDYGPNDMIPVTANFRVSNPWDNYRNQYDQSGFVSRFTAMMPEANDWQVGDGLNIAGYRWTRTSKGSATIFGGNLYDDNRKALTVKIDHNINVNHRISGTYSYETNYGDDGERVWPESYGGYGGLIERKPQTFTVTLTSTLSPMLLNEFRVGMSRTETETYDSIYNPQTGSTLSQILVDLIGSDDATRFPRYTNLPILAGAGAGGTAIESTLFHPEGGLNSQPYGSRGNLSTTWGGVDPRWTFADTVTWMKGSHSFKGGVEYRMQKSYQENNGLPSFSNGADTYPSVKGGVLSSLSPYRDDAFSSGASAWQNMPAADLDYFTGLRTQTGNYAGAYNLMTYMTGSIGVISQYFFVTDAKNPRWNKAGDGELFKVADLRNREFSAFFKDDWKLNNSLTLNLGVRYEYYGVPWDAQGLTAGVLGGFAAAMGATGGDLSNWMPTVSQLESVSGPAGTGDTGYRTQQAFIGPNSSHPEISAFNKDMNNFAPHVGFAWQLPWFGAGKTTLRGGYSISYTKVSNFDNTFGYSSVLSNAPGMTYAYLYSGGENCLGVDQNGAAPGNGCYLNFDNFGKLLPLYDSSSGFLGMATQPTILGEQPIYKRDQTLSMYDPNIRNPYIQNLTLSLTRQIGNNLTVDVRYIGTLTRKGISSTSMGLNVNTPNLINSGLMEELIKVRAGGESAMLNEMIRPGTLNVQGNNFTLSGSQQIRNQYATNLALGNMNAVAAALATANGAATGSLATLQAPGVSGLVLRNSASGSTLNGKPTPENLIYANPQYAAVYVRRNQEHANYHSMQAQVTMRPTRGLNFQATYTWSRNLARAAVTDYRDWTADYWLSGQHRSHQLNVNGTYTLPFGANGFIARNASGLVKKAVEGWQVGWIASAVSGVPMSLTGATTLWANGAMNITPEGEKLWNNKAGKVEWDDELNDGQFFGGKYERIIDPQCFNPAVIAPGASGIPGTGLQGTCATNASGLKAIVLVDPSKPVAGYQTVNTVTGALSNPVNGTIIFENPLPGQRGNFQGPRLTGPGRWNLDMNISKSIEFMEGKRIELRVDAQNIFNHATPSYGSSTLGARNNTISNPYVTVNTNSSNSFGLLDTKTGHRTFQGKIRISF
jgi:hypothetical protein